MYARDIARIATPVGVVTIYGDDTAVTSVKIEAMGGGPKLGAASPVRDAADQIQAWFAGERTAFDLPLANAQTDRGQILRDAMIAIGYGEVLSYGRLAATIGSSPRAIGQACARNPFPIIVPCHRVTNADGSLGAYSAGEGPATKRWLLDFERRGHRDRLL
ncbi:MAG: methylated-DNA--[protein]-cysteine S-methyltransferase [Sphingomonas sp.]|jgi:methylated-DNA-[protein]-cysteine S-methyltransferase|uniref:methylated-DNA--[protein]-cysteine S-methyltransferase n=1 Tax=Sphingomonas sp. TaxID=28214 RepID=UPI0035669593